MTLLILISIVTSCGSDDEENTTPTGSNVDCTTLFNSKLKAAIENFNNDESTANCLALKAAVQEYVAAGCDTLGEYENGLNDLDC